ncbi:hypothetical protein BGZ73_005310 [Actinomortierella ambigua]|nr:hypothetical protein BGZ73_005310 [Actinomortierella ambigua]
MSSGHARGHKKVPPTVLPPESPSSSIHSTNADSSHNPGGKIGMAGLGRTHDANSISGATPPTMQPNQSRERRPPSTHAVQAPPVAHARDVLLPQRKRTWGKWIFRLVLVWLGYVMLFVCPTLPDKESGAVCRGLHRVREWISPLSDPLYVKVDETYRTHGKPLVDQYGRPLVQQGQQYYAHYAQPALDTASKRTKDAYVQYAHPHIVRAKGAVYNDQVKGHLQNAQSSFNTYSKQAQVKMDEARKATRQASGHAWHWHHQHVQPTIDKVSPHAKVAWDKAVLGAHHISSDVSELYVKHINPYAQHSITVVMQAAEHGTLALAEHIDQLFGSHLAKKLKKAKPQPMDKIHMQSEKVKHDAEVQAKGLKGWWRKKTAEVQQAADAYIKNAQKMAGQFSESVHESSAGFAATMKGKVDDAHHAAEHAKEEAEKQAASTKDQVWAANKGAQEKVKQAVEHVTEAVAHKAHEAQKMAADTLHNVEHAAGQVGRKVMEKAYGAGEAIKSSFASKSGEIKRTTDKAQKDAQEAIHHAQENAKHTAEQIQKQGSEHLHHAKGVAEETVDQLKGQAESLKAKATDSLKEAQAQTAKKADETAQHVREEVREAKENVQHKYEDVKHSASEHRHHMEEQAKKAQEAAQDHAKDAKERFEEMFSYGKDAAQQYVMDANRAKDQAVRDTMKKLENAKEATETSLKAMLAGIEATFGHFLSYEKSVSKERWDSLQSEIEEHTKQVKKSIKEAEDWNAQRYHQFEDFVKKWSSDASGSVEDRVLQLRQQADKVAAEITHHAKEKQQEGQSKIKLLTTHIETFVNGLRGFLLDRLEAAKQTALVDFNVFKDTSSNKDETTVKGKLLHLEEQGRKRVEDVGADVSKKAKLLLDEAQKLWATSEQQTKEMIEKLQARSLEAAEQAKKAAEDARTSVKSKVDDATANIKDATGQKQSTKEETLKGKLEEATDKVRSTVKETAEHVQADIKAALTPGENDSSQKNSNPFFDGPQSEPNVKVAYEEPRSGHRHRRH